ncbi:MAG: TonB-dependent receptor [Bacteroidetes bacterium]|nr:TonB-dependent receptor [Bacteroidota bacterium]
MKKKTKISKALILTACATLISMSMFQSIIAQTTKDTTVLKEMIVTGTPVEVNKNNVPMAVSIVSRSQIEENNKSAILPILNGRVPGLFVTERGITGFGVSTGAGGQITMRGIGGNPTTGVLMLIDGHPQFMGIFGHPLSDSYIASDVERVEVIRGPASILYGSNAMGGVINIITRKQKEDGLNLNLNIMGGSYNTQKYAISVGSREKKSSSFTSFNYDHTDGHRFGSKFDIYNGYHKLTYQINPYLNITGDVSLAKFNTQDPGIDTLNAQVGTKMNIIRGYGAFTFENNYKKYTGMAKVFYNFGDHRMSDGFHSTDANYGANISESVKLFKGNNITIGCDYANYGGKAETELGGGKYMGLVDTTIYEIGIYGFVQQTLFKKLTINAGIRMQDNEVYGQEWIPSGGFAFSIAKKTTWKANVSKGFRSPTIRELFMWNHNSDLNPEKIMNYETGVLQSFFNNKLNLELTGFIVKGNNMIVTGAMGKLFNTGEINNKGIEFAANANPVKNFALNFTYSYIDMKKYVYATPKHHFFLSSSYKWSKLQLTAGVQQINHLNTESNPSKSLYFEDYTLLNVKISYKVRKYAEIFISGENLLDQKYETLRYYTMPGITVFGGANLKF